jgi:hypothetical protein
MDRPDIEAFAALPPGKRVGKPTQDIINYIAQLEREVKAKVPKSPPLLASAVKNAINQLGEVIEEVGDDEANALGAIRSALTRALEQ